MTRPWARPTTAESEQAAQLMRQRELPRPVALALVRRGLREEGEHLEAFLNPRLDTLGDPATIPNVAEAVERVWSAIDGGEGIFVHGDYDVDGISGTAFLTRTLRALGGRVTPYVPNRAQGYGLGDEGIAAAQAENARVMLTVDCGTTAVEPIARARAAGIDVIVIDHHQPKGELPAAHAVVNPLLDPEAEDFHTLAAVGVAAKFIHAMALARRGSLPHDVYREALQLVALGTVADVVPLVGENRILVAHGLRQLADSTWPGIQALKASARLNGSRVTSTDVAFFLAPRINAVGRMADASDALAILLCEDAAEAWRLADHLERLNLERRKVDQQVLEAAMSRLPADADVPPAIVLWGDDWPLGVVGIVASRLVDRYRRPVLVISLDGDLGRASARSLPSFPLHVALEKCTDLLEAHGGHAQAAGFTIRRNRLEPFRERMIELASAVEFETEAAPLQIDAEVKLDEMTADCMDWLQRLEPFGSGNPEPLFGAEGIVLADEPTIVGKRHLRLQFQSGTRRIKGIAFNQGDRAKDLRRGQRVAAAFHASFDTWRGGRQIQLVVRDLKTG